MTNDKIIIDELQPIENVKFVYAGRPGCACGCNGTYYPDMNYTTNKRNPITPRDSRMIKRVYKLFQKFLREDKVFSWIGYVNNFVCLNVSPNRTYTMYFKE